MVEIRFDHNFDFAQRLPTYQCNNSILALVKSRYSCALCTRKKSYRFDFISICGYNRVKVGGYDESRDNKNSLLCSEPGRSRRPHGRRLLCRHGRHATATFTVNVFADVGHPGETSSRNPDAIVAQTDVTVGRRPCRHLFFASVLTQDECDHRYPPSRHVLSKRSCQCRRYGGRCGRKAGLDLEGPTPRTSTRTRSSKGYEDQRPAQLEISSSWAGENSVDYAPARSKTS